MEKIKKYFGNYEITWARVLLLAVITAAYTALVNELDFLDGTSFQDIAINLECWLLFAVFIIVNCKKWWEAALKCFVFFLISQPLIYLLEVPFEQLGWGIFSYYGHWFRITLLTLPGGAVAFGLKKKNWLSVAVLSAATIFLAYSGVSYLKSAIWNPPFHILSAVFCFMLAVFFIMVLLDDKKHRVAALAIFAAALIISAVITGIFYTASVDIALPAGDWEYTIEDDSVIRVELDDGSAVVTPIHNGNTWITFTSSDGTELEYYVSVLTGSIWISPRDD